MQKRIIPILIAVSILICAIIGNFYNQINDDEVTQIDSSYRIVSTTKRTTVPNVERYTSNYMDRLPYILPETDEIVECEYPEIEYEQVLVSSYNVVKVEVKPRIYILETDSANQGGLLEIDDPDMSYSKYIVSISGEDRDLLEALVEGEAGDQGFIGAALVAQCIKDAIYYRGYNSVAEVRTSLKYSGSITRKPCQNVIDAVAYVFDEGGYAVRHPILYFYMFSHAPGTWHETQIFVVEYKDHRFFWRRS